MATHQVARPPLTSRRTDTAALRGMFAGVTTARMLAVFRIALGWTFLWAFLDKLFGFGYSSKTAWFDGGSPTMGFLTFSTHGPMQTFYGNIAGTPWADWLFMLGLAGVGIALVLGVGVRIAGAVGALMYVLMWIAYLPPTNNPVIDDHTLGTIAMVTVAVANAGSTWGLGVLWQRLEIVKRNPLLK